MSERTANKVRSSLSVVLRRFATDAGGGTAIEYAMIGGLIFAVIAGSLKLYGSRLNGVYVQIGNAMAQVY